MRLIGARQSPVVVIDDATGDFAGVIEIAAALAPFGASAGNHYPGLRRAITAEDGPASAYVQRILDVSAPLLSGGLHIDRYDLLEASFSMVTAAPATLSPQQRAPHFDSIDPNYIAVLHYLSDTPGTGTAFFRQRSTGIEIVDDGNAARFVAAARAEPIAQGYIHGSTPQFEQIGLVEAVPDRLVIYRGAMLHSGVIPADMVLSDDPRIGRLTANIFVGGR